MAFTIALEFVLSMFFGMLVAIMLSDSRLELLFEAMVFAVISWAVQFVLKVLGDDD